ncbi:MAG: sulfurtransferase TusA family protein [Deltaproteobacteria bacterium]|nr:sulfurtransferase TusA family protein [Deltaproteobacteria bacterium]
MSQIIEARGLSCPQPVIMTNKKLKELGKGLLEVLVDTETAKENITRLAQQSGWQLDVNEESADIRLVLKKV